MTILNIMGYIGADDQTVSEQIYEVITNVLKRANDTGIHIGYALVYQCIKTITMIVPNQPLIDLASNIISRFLSSESHSLKYIGITGLASIVKIDSHYIVEYQGLVVDCLEDADETLKFKTLELLYKMTNAENVEPIVEKLLSQLVTIPIDSGVRKDLVMKINSLGHSFAPTKNWYVKTINRLFEMGGDMITDDLCNKFITKLREFEKETDAQKFRESTIKIYLKILKKNSNVPDSMMRVISWIFGEYGPQHPDPVKKQKILTRLAESAYRGWEDYSTICWIISAISKVHLSLNFEENKKVEKVIRQFKSSKNLDIRQRSIEYGILREKQETQIGQFVNLKTPMNDEAVQLENFDFSLNFLLPYVQALSGQGKEGYQQDKSLVFVAPISAKGRDLKFGAYDAPTRGHYPSSQ